MGMGTIINRELLITLFALLALFLADIAVSSTEIIITGFTYRSNNIYFRDYIIQLKVLKI